MSKDSIDKLRLGEIRLTLAVPAMVTVTPFNALTQNKILFDDITLIQRN